MTRESIVAELVSTHELDERQARRVMFEAIKDGAIQEHPEFNGTYVCTVEYEE
jgi:glycine betaine/choline ABC-type transport system substrate-binding protein